MRTSYSHAGTPVHRGLQTLPLALAAALCMILMPVRAGAQDHGTDSTEIVLPPRLFPVSPGTDTTLVTASHDSVRSELWRAGLNMGLQFNLFDAAFTALPGIPSCCPEYRDGGGTGFGIGGFFEMPLSRDLWLGAQLFYADLGGTTEAKETETVYDGSGAVTATFGHSIESNIHVIGIGSAGIYEPISGLQFFAGPRLHITAGSSFHQEERILAPSDIRYENNRRTRLQYDGDIPKARWLSLAVAAGGRYELPWKGIRHVTLAPEISGWYSFGGVADGIDWNVHGIRLGISAIFTRHAPPPPSPPKPEPAKAPDLLPPLDMPRGPSGAGG